MIPLDAPGTTVGLSEEAHAKIDRLKEQYFAEKSDCYRLAFAIALAQGVLPPDITNRRTAFNVGTFDPDQLLLNAVRTVMPDQCREVHPYKLIERLAEWGVHELAARSEEAGFQFSELFKRDVSVSK